MEKFTGDQKYGDNFNLDLSLILHEKNWFNLNGYWINFYVSKRYSIAYISTQRNKKLHMYLTYWA